VVGCAILARRISRLYTSFGGFSGRSLYDCFAGMTFMPIHEYTCDACGEAFEHLRAGDASNKGAKCPKCGSRKLSRRISVFAAGRGQEEAASAGGNVCGRCGDIGPCAAGGF